MGAPTSSVRLNAEGLYQVRIIAALHGMTLREYLEALMHYAISVDRRPGSWEAGGFDPRNYSNEIDADGYPVGFADRWFS